MSESDPSLISKLLGGAAAALAAIGTWAWGHTHKRIDEKASQDELNKLVKHVEEHTIHKDVFAEHAKSDDQRLEQIGQEVSGLRTNQARIFDLMREMEKAATVRHETLLTAIFQEKK